MNLATSENNTQNSSSELIHLQIEYLKEHNAYDLAISNLLNPHVGKYSTCISIPDAFNWDNTPEGYIFWRNIQSVFRFNGLCIITSLQYCELFELIFPKALYPHLYI